jgi:predicted methyltransferase MtxX (methanogen marker protein 4)
MSRSTRQSKARITRNLRECDCNGKKPQVPPLGRRGDLGRDDRVSRDRKVANGTAATRLGRFPT